MATKRWILLLLAAAMMTLLAGCGGSTFNVQNPGPPAQSQVTIAFGTQPAPTIAAGSSETITAVVTNDPDNLGVTWALSCNPTGNCGTLTVDGVATTQTASGSPILYTAPSSLAGNSAVVQIVALATYDPNKNAVAPITIGSFGGLQTAKNYVFQAQGTTAAGSPYQIAGVIHVDGMGGIVPVAPGQPAGEQTSNPNGVAVTDSIVSGSYFIGSDGRGTITINTGDTSIGGNGIETFTTVFLNGGTNPQGLIAQVDFGSAKTGVSARGTLDLQQVGFGAPAGSYAFVVNGTDTVDSLPMGLGGVFDIQSQGAVTGVVDEVLGEKVKLSDSAFLTGSQISAPDQYGQVTLTLTGLLDGIHPKTVGAVFAGYIVDATHIDLIETDTATTSTVTPLGFTGGLAIGQTSGSFGTFTDASLLGPFTYGVTGVDLAQLNTLPNTWTLAGVVTADGQSDGALTSGYIDSFLDVNCVQATCVTGGTTGAQISSTFTGTYAVDSASSSCGATSGTVVAGTGRACLIPTTFGSTPSPTYRPELYFYLTGQTGEGEVGALVLGVGDNGTSPNLHYPSLGTGIAYVQSGAAATFAGPYGISFTDRKSVV